MIVLMLSCGPPKTPPPAAAIEATADTGASTSPPVTTGGPATRSFLPPSSRVVRNDGITLTGFVAVVPAHAGEPGVILAEGWSDAFGDPEIVYDPTFVLRGDLAPGDHDVTEAWDGTIRFADIWPYGSVVSAGDVDGDGHLDLWFGQHLLQGPILGIDVDINGGSPRILASLEGEVAVAGDVDADGDGVIDVIAQSDRGNDGYIHYGPFSGPIPSARLEVADPATYSTLGGTYCAEIAPGGFWLRDHLGPGRDVIAIGSDIGGCQYDAFLWDPFVPQGTHRDRDQALAAFKNWPTVFSDVALYDVGDIDGDGYPDAVYEHASNAQLIGGPLSGTYDMPGDQGFEQQMLHGDPSRAMPDINGDGLPELLGEWQWTAATEGTDPDQQRTWVLMCSPHPFPIDFATGIPLLQAGKAGFFYATSFLAKPSVDLDGDGLADLVDLVYEDGSPESLSIWYGKDLAAACSAQQSTPD